VTITLDAASTGCTLSTGVVTFTAGGTCVIDANQAGNATYNAAPQAQQSITVNKAAQTVAFTSTSPGTVGVGGPAAALGGPGYTPSASATSGLPAAITLDATSTGCTLSSGLVSFTAAGTCALDAAQAGNSSWNPASQTQQTITVVAEADVSLSAVHSPPRPGADQVRISVTNDGPSTVTVTVVITAEYGESPGGSARSFGGASGCFFSTGGLTCTATLAPGQTQFLAAWGAAGGATWVNGVAEVTVASQPDPDSTPNNHLNGEDDYVTFTVTSSVPV
jgi:hypothetical protein